MKERTLFAELYDVQNASSQTVCEPQILIGDSLEVLPTLSAESIQCCVTSPPYWGLRDYDHPAQIGAEASPEIYVENLVAIFREVRRVLRKDGTVWLNVGDGYARNGGTGNCGPNAIVGNTKKLVQKRNCKVLEPAERMRRRSTSRRLASPK